MWFILMCLLVSACDALPSTPSSGSSPTSTVTLTPSIPVNNHPKSTPTTSSNRTPYNNQVKAYLGSDASAFRALYGSHGDTTLKGTIIWTLSQTEWFTLTFDTINNHVYDLDHYFYPSSPAANHQQDDVSFDVARKTCSHFIPPDSVLISVKNSKPDPALTDGIQYVYKSAWLAHQLDALWFYFDEGTGSMLVQRNTPVDPGIYTLFYIGTEETGYEMCFLTTGVNWPY